MPGERIEEVHAGIAERVDGPIRCPICGHEEGTPFENAVLSTLATTHDRFVRINKRTGEEARGSEEDHWTIFGVGAFWSDCGFLRLHAVAVRRF